MRGERVNEERSRVPRVAVVAGGDVVMTRRAMTIVEVLLAISIIVVLTSILIVALRRVKPMKDEMMEVSNLRMTMTDFLAWAAEHEEKWPTYGLPEKTAPSGMYSRIGQASNAAMMAAELYFGAITSWPSILGLWKGSDEPHWYQIGGPDLSFAANWPASSTPVGPFPSKYQYTNTMRTRPELWQWPGAVPRMNRRGEMLPWASDVAVADVKQPSGKGVLVYDSGGGASPATRLYVAFADGSARLMDAASAKPTAFDPLDRTIGRGDPVLATLDGYLGSDF